MKGKLIGEFLKMIRLFLIHNQIFGLATLSNKGKTFTSSGMRKFYTAILTFGYLVFVGFVFYALPDVTGVPASYKTTSYIIMVGTVIYVTSSWICSLINCKKYIKLLITIMDFDVKLQTNCIIMNYKKNKNKILYHLLMRYGIMIILFTFYHMDITRTQWGEQLSEAAVLFMVAFNSAVCYQATELVYLLKSRFTILNKQITSLVEYFQTKVSVIEAQKSIQKKFEILTKICTLHHQLSKCVKLFNEVFGVILLLMFTISFVYIVLCFFYTSGTLQKPNPRLDDILYTLAAAVPFIFDSVFVCHVCYTTIEEANKSGELIHRIDTADHDMIDEIEMFSLQIANQQVEFNAAGFFPINYTLVFSIIGGVTTYIIILIQLSASIDVEDVSD